MSEPVLVTGSAGFIGFHVAKRLLSGGRQVVGVDSFSDYYDPALKRARFEQLLAQPGFTGAHLDVAEPGALERLFKSWRFRVVVHLAAQPGVRHALSHPEAYVSANVAGFLAVLEACRHAGIGHLIYASSSSVYGANTKLPFAEGDPVNHPISLYAATKRANELMAHSYSHLFGVPSTGLRFFTVYGPWGRPDMAVFRFTDRIARGEPIEVAAAGEVARDFTFVDDAVEAVMRVIDGPTPTPDPSEARADRSAVAAFRLFNIGGDRPSNLNRVLDLIERELGRAAIRIATPLPPGDVPATGSDASCFAEAYGAIEPTSLEEGIRQSVAWYRAYHRSA